MNTNNLSVVNNSDKMSVIDLVYPVGSIYLSLDPNFDPNISWGGGGF